MNYTAYLERIGYTGELQPTLEVLRQLQKRHLLSVPFENLDIHHGVPIELDVERIFNKVVLQKRGGFCYELNGLYFELLTAIGFDVRRISAKVYSSSEGTYTPEYDHLALLVTIAGEDYLTDVGFGEFSFAPLKMALNQVQADARGNYIFDRYDEDYYRISRVEDGEIRPEYIFRTAARAFDEFTGMCHFHQTDPGSHFRQRSMITLPTEQGRITLTENKLKIKEGDLTRETAFKDATEYEVYLWKYFGVKPVGRNS
ncbi:arylamine N-acetyltransferase [Pontibacter sp. HSC-36F09]|uniref:arylamine N-acetyltransferase family protein n=1 Tax=Pontibacter sp. HSC-36F09 TaxID=2910966 RepID=UPI0020A0614B|nr:arylamine N-acetyltransferase [Pontibacter sp. HSC-36F09]MCP2043267.1 N-hydroxyarylamine O-acetyltransferase [Pontibacter sp. HSC-36F09]